MTNNLPICAKCGKPILGSAKFENEKKVHVTCPPANSTFAHISLPPEEDVPMPEGLTDAPAGGWSPKGPPPAMAGLPEAPFSNTFQWQDAEGFVHMTTVRAWTSEELFAGLSIHKQAIRLIKGQPFVRDDNRFGVKVLAAPAKATEVAPEMVLAPPPTLPSKGAMPSMSGELAVNVAKIKIVPDAGSKLKVEFYEDGHKFPDLTWYSDVTRAITGLAPVAAFTADHLKAAGEYALPCKAIYKQSSKLNQKGNPYKDFVRVDAA